MGRLYCRLAIELPTQTRQLVVGDTGAAHYGAAHCKVSPGDAWQRICVELNLHQMGLTPQVSAPENLASSGDQLPTN